MTQPKEGHYNDLINGLVSEVDLYSAVPAYAETLTEAEMVAILACIKMTTKNKTLNVVGEWKMRCGGCESTVKFTLGQLLAARQVKASHKTQ